MIRRFDLKKYKIELNKLIEFRNIVHNRLIFIPIFRIEEELLLRRSLGDLEADTGRRATTSARRSFFRRKKHQRSSSRDSKELSHLTGVNLGWYSDSGTLNEENLPASYQRVEKLDCES